MLNHFRKREYFRSLFEILLSNQEVPFSMLLNEKIVSYDVRHFEIRSIVRIMSLIEFVKILQVRLQREIHLR